MSKKVKDSNRNERIAAKVQTIVAEILRTEYADDPVLGAVSLSGAGGGIQFVRLFFHCHTNDIDTVQRRLDVETKTIRYKMGQRLDQKYVPQIRFAYDDTLERAERIDELLASIGG
ncbi:MAG: ribosome-binding factor A [Alphaproteobacteria bacterium]|nr:ribosome-binding factor A [Alphaproteobacteria bacterium]